MILYLEEECFSIWVWQWWKFSERLQGPREILVESVESILSKLPHNTLIDIVVEAIDETYQQEYIPNIAKSERDILINKKIKQYFSQDSFFAAHQINFTGDKIHYSLIGIDADFCLKKVLNLLRHYPVVLKGLYLSSQIAVDRIVRDLNSKLLPTNKYLLIEFIFPNIIRKSFIQNNRLVYSHRNELLPEQFINDIEHSLYFYQQINLLNSNETLVSIFFCEHKNSEIIPLQQFENENIQKAWQSISSNHDENKRSQFLVENLKQYSPKLNLLANSDLKRLYALRIKYLIFFISFILMVALILDVTRLHYVKKHLVEVSQASYLEKLDLQKKFIAQQSLLPISPDSLDKIETLVSIDNSLVNAKHSPQPLIEFLSHIFNNIAEIHIQRLRWIISPDPQYPDQESNPLEKTSVYNKNQSYYQVMYLDGYLDDHSSSLSLSGKIFQQFIFELRKH